MAEEPKQEEKKLNGTETKVSLRKAVIANGEEVKELVFREPTGGDIERVGNPVIIDWSDGARIDYKEKSMAAMMALLANVPPSTIRQMHPGDWSTAAMKLSGFFMPDLDQL